ncbi:hypothetical protein AVEN_69057-1 [Araneus ventricosus]|uniref:Uncharacterized protein n=1 Tax=Araneus ventricosus TaxID=182803 RepID=A0A4Y2THD7_ARAVE|nr:hypothetical protein AVEN_69057-1 [Araneus ventricosus]
MGCRKAGILCSSVCGNSCYGICTNGAHLEEEDSDREVEESKRSSLNWLPSGQKVLWCIFLCRGSARSNACPWEKVADKSGVCENGIVSGGNKTDEIK